MYDKMFQPKDEIQTLSMVNKIVYTKQWGNFIFSPGIDFRLYKKHVQNLFNRSIIIICAYHL